MRQPFYAVAEKHASQKLGREVKLTERSHGIKVTDLSEIGLIGSIISFETDSGPIDIDVPWNLS